MKVCNYHRALASSKMVPKIQSKFHRHFDSVTSVLSCRILRLSNLSKRIYDYTVSMGTNMDLVHAN